MKKMLSVARRLVGATTIGASSVGIAFVLLQTGQLFFSQFSVFLVTLSLIIFVYGIVVGVMVLESSTNWQRWALPYWLIQLPVLYLPIVTYQIALGPYFIVFVDGTALRFNVGAGASVLFEVQSAEGTAYGVNLIAVLIVLFLVYDDRKVRNAAA